MGDGGFRGKGGEYLEICHFVVFAGGDASLDFEFMFSFRHVARGV